ncbi:MAG TPA: ATP-binding cassette domain-containing protein [Acidimicrobiia bacterium]|nr:ATP-binding cassette domain-containing protein [Acidimicrobiia bacterium]
MSLLSCHEVSVSFGGLKALDEVTLDVPPGQVTGLIGPNGAGKTTLFNAICGLQPLNEGGIQLDGREISTERPHKRARLGIARTFQRLETFGTLSVRDNVLVAAEMRRGWSRERFRPGALTDQLVERVGLASVAGERVDQLPTGTQRLVEVARALATKPRVLLLDEPSAGLNEEETTELAALLRELAATGLGILLVEHDMGLVMSASDGIHVLDFGRIIAVGTPEDVQADPLVRAAYLGEGEAEEDVVPSEQRELLEEVVLDVPAAPSATTTTSPSRDAPTTTARYALELVDVRAAYGTITVLDGVTLRLEPRKVFALLGPNGAGKSTTLKVISGQLPPFDGTVSLFGERVNGWSPDRLARAGLCTIPEGRGIFPNLSVLENLRMITYTGVSLRDVEERAFQRFPRLGDRRKQVAGTLSGGEQQMLSMARAMATEPRVLLLDELSMGLAPLIVEELYEVVGRIAAEDVAIVIVEQFAHEVLGVADVAAIMLHGRIQYTGPPREVGETLQRAYLGGAVPE